MLNRLAAGVLLLYTRMLAGREADSPAPVANAVAAIALLVVALALSVYKPRGTTPWSGRKNARS